MAWMVAAGATAMTWGAERPRIQSVTAEAGRVVIVAGVPAGYRHVLLTGRATVLDPAPEPLIAGGLDAGETLARFSLPMDAAAGFLTLQAGTSEVIPTARYEGPAYFSATRLSDAPLSPAEQVDHVLNRLAYGPSPADLSWANESGPGAYILSQLQPGQIDEAANTRLQQREAALFTDYQPHQDTFWVRAGDVCRYFKGTQAPPANWTRPDFDDSTWLQGPSGFGYGDDDDGTVLADMRRTTTQPGYLSVFVRRTFEVADPAAVDALILRVDYDDGFVAYLNGEEVARANVTGTPPAFDRAASDTHEAGEPVEFDLTSRRALLRPGANVLALQAHNTDLESSDLSLIPELVQRTALPGPTLRRIRGLTELQQLIHVRGVYARRQLQAVLGELWENHFTTDADKVASYFDDLSNSDGADAMPANQARAEAAQVEYEEYQFFHDQALGYFGDLLLCSATSPAMLIYLDNVLNRKGAPNENYAREILELFAFGVDNRYTQKDIEELARCFTGWHLRKTWPADRPAFPASARTPLIDDSVQVAEEVQLPLGPGWRYFKGEREPSPAPNGTPTLAWTLPGFDAASWLAGATGIGYGDGDDTTTLTDMRGRYASVYVRREFVVPAGARADDWALSVAYDDGFVAYLNGVEVARSPSMEDTGTPPRFNTFTASLHEAEGNYEVFSLKPYLHLLKPAPEINVLAFQVHNAELDSSDLSLLPRVVERRLLPGSIEKGDPNGTWVFRFNPAEHDTGAKRLFVGTPFELNLPAGRTGREAVRDALEVIDAMLAHPSTREFICLKLINRLVSDDLSLESYRNGTAPAGLRQLMDDALAAWMSTTPPGHIETVVRALLRPATREGYFWSQSAYRAKVKTPIEFINSSLRALDANVSGVSLPDANGALGMDLFTRDDPDGWSELGFDWMDTRSLLERIKFLQRLAGNTDSRLGWNLDALLAGVPTRSAEAIIDHLAAQWFPGRVSAADRALLVRFVTTDDQGQPLPLDPGRADFRRRVQDLVALILAMPQWHLQ